MLINRGGRLVLIILRGESDARADVEDFQAAVVIPITTYVANSLCI